MRQLWVDGPDDGARVDELGVDVAVDDWFQVGYPVAEVIDAFDCLFELSRGSAQVGKCLVKCFVPEKLLSCVVAPWQDEAPGSEGHRGQDVFMEGLSQAFRPTCCGLAGAAFGLGDVASGDTEQQRGRVEEPVGRVQPAVVGFLLGGVPMAELLVDGVAEDDFENVQGFIGGTGEVDVPPVETDGLLQGGCLADVGCQALWADPVPEDQFYRCLVR
jgi:hypothetical protein